jgi:stearoyl-CoA desaturase (Delta-9 desaturase)
MIRAPENLNDVAQTPKRPASERVALVSSIPFFLVHVAALAAFWVETSSIDWAVCAFLYLIRMFGITAGYHRYFSHRAFRVGRGTQFMLAFIGTMSAQKGVLWWAAHHRQHHKYSDKKEDIHSPTRGFWWSHMGWILSTKYDETPYDKIGDLTRYPELVWLNRNWVLPPVLLALFLFSVGGLGMLLTGFFMSTVLLYHGTFTINSLSHCFGKKRFLTGDLSRNNIWLALLTLGEGWHNNHHHYQSSANQGFYWWEIDISYYIICLMERTGLAWDVRRPTASALARNRLDQVENAPFTGNVPGARLRPPGSLQTVE